MRPGRRRRQWACAWATAPPCSSAAPADAVILRAGCTLRGMTCSSVARHAAFAALVLVCRPAVAEPALRLWYEKPAGAWVEALPVGNGRLGAMVFGDPRHVCGASNCA